MKLISRRGLFTFLCGAAVATKIPKPVPKLGSVADQYRRAVELMLGSSLGQQYFTTKIGGVDYSNMEETKP